MPRTLGITEAQRQAALSLCNSLIGAPGVDREVERRATWLKWAIEGERPNDETLVKLAFMRRA